MESIGFGRQINYVPMSVSLGVGVVTGGLVVIFAHQWLLAVILGAAMLVVCAFLYARSMNDFYGYWEVTNDGVRYYNYQNMSIRLQSVLLPFSESPEQFKYQDVEALTVVVGKEMNAPSNILGGSFYAPKKIMFHLPTPYYLDVKLKDGREAYLDLSADWDDTETIEAVIAIIAVEANISPEIVKQA